MLHLLTHHLILLNCILALFTLVCIFIYFCGLELLSATEKSGDRFFEMFEIVNYIF